MSNLADTEEELSTLYEGLEKLVVNELSLSKKKINELEQKINKMDLETRMDLMTKNFDTRLDLMEKIFNTSMSDVDIRLDAMEKEVESVTLTLTQTTLTLKNAGKALASCAEEAPEASTSTPKKTPMMFLQPPSPPLSSPVLATAASDLSITKEDQELLDPFITASTSNDKLATTFLWLLNVTQHYQALLV